jgi:hypothetical protein
MCCSFLQFDLSRQDSDLVLEISGPPLARPVIERFLALEAASHPRRD